MVGGQAANPWRSGEALKAAPTANSVAIAPYLMDSVTRWGSDDEFYGPLMAQPEQMSRDGIVQATQAAAGGRQLAVYEVNLHSTEGTAPQAVLDRLTDQAHIIETGSESYRFRRTRGKKQKQSATTHDTA